MNNLNRIEKSNDLIINRIKRYKGNRRRSNDRMNSMNRMNKMDRMDRIEKSND
jgi:hypothetical protein